MWERTGPYELLVDKQSAIQADSNPQDCFPIDEDHSGMVKFSDGSPEYHTVIGFMHSLLPSVLPNSRAALEDKPFNVHDNRTGGIVVNPLRGSTNAAMSCPEANPF